MVPIIQLNYITSMDKMTPPIEKKLHHYAPLNIGDKIPTNTSTMQCLTSRNAYTSDTYQVTVYYRYFISVFRPSVQLIWVKLLWGSRIERIVDEGWNIATNRLLTFNIPLTLYSTCFPVNYGILSFIHLKMGPENGSKNVTFLGCCFNGAIYHNLS
jgi:hypothetical protein